MSTTFEELIKKTIAESFAEMLPKLAPKAGTVPDVMTRKQVAEYAQVSEGTIKNLSRRADNPLPVASIGDVRYFRIDVERWMREEAARKLASAKKAA